MFGIIVLVGATGMLGLRVPPLTLLPAQNVGVCLDDADPVKDRNPDFDLVCFFRTDWCELQATFSSRLRA